MDQRAFWSLAVLLVTWGYFFWPPFLLNFNKNKLEPKGLIVILATAIVLSTAYLILKKRGQLQRVAFTSSQLGLFCLFILTLFWVLAEPLGLTSIQQTTVILMLPIIVLTALGPYASKTLLFPLLYLLLLIPLFDQDFSNPQLIFWLGFALLFAHLRFRSHLRQIIFIGIALLAWWISMWMHASWFVFLILFVALFVIGWFMAEPEQQFNTFFFQEDQYGKRLITQSSRWLMPTLVAFSMMMISPWMADNIRTFYPLIHKKVTLMAPLGIGQWTGPFEIKNPDWAPKLRRPSVTISVEYKNTKDDSPVDLFCAYYHSDRSLEEILSSDSKPYNDQIWQAVSTNKVNITLGKLPVTAVETVLQNGIAFRLQWSWYFVSGISSTDIATLKLLDTIRLISKSAGGPGMIVLSAPYVDNKDQARASLQSFIEQMSNGLGILEQPERIKFR